MTSYVRQRLASVMLILLGAAAVWLLMSLVAVVRAYADTGAPPVEPLDLQTKLAIWAAGLYAVARVVLELLRVIAPRTPTKVDDEMRDTLAEILTHVRPPTASPRDPQAGSVRLWPLTILAGAAIGIASQAMWLTGCATAERAGAAAKVAALDCGKEYAPAVAGTLARWAANSAIAGKPDWAALEHDAEGLAIGAGVCLYAEALKAWKSRPTPQAVDLGGGPDELVAAKAGLERLRAKLGGAQIKLADGTIL